MKALAKKLPENKDKYCSPYLLNLLRKCNNYGISYSQMCMLNFKDLQYMIIEYDIQAVKDYFKMKQENQNAKRGVNIKTASNEEIGKMYRKKEVINGKR